MMTSRFIELLLAAILENGRGGDNTVHARLLLWTEILFYTFPNMTHLVPEGKLLFFHISNLIFQK